jgi:hypothetical protein
MARVKVGQVYENLGDRRGRTFEVIDIEHGKAVCKVLTAACSSVQQRVGHVTRVCIHRLGNDLSLFRRISGPLPDPVKFALVQEGD